MRSRNIKPDFFTSDQVLACEPLARILFAGLWSLADRRGRLEDRPTKIKIKILPCDNCEIDTLLNQLQRNGLIHRYEINNRRYIQVINFEKHQNPHHKEPESILPAPDFDAMLEPSMTIKPRASPGHVSDPPVPVPADSLIPDSLIPESPMGDSARAKGVTKPGKKSQTDRLLFESLPPEWAQWVHGELGWNAETTADVWACFRDYWQRKTGKSAQKSDWEATWRMWCRRQIIHNSGGNHETNLRHYSQGARASKSERARAAIIESAVELGYAHPSRRDGQD
jgi:hypothetical protein